MKHAFPIEIKIDDHILHKQFNVFQALMPMALYVAMLDSMREVGFRAVSEFMLHTPGPHGDKLGMRTTELMRSLTDGFGFSRNPGGTRWSIREIKFLGEVVVGIYGSKLPYSAIHEFGGEFLHPNLFGRGIQARIHMPARPYLRPALKRSQRQIDKFFMTAIKRVVKKTNGI